jgi:transposase
MKKKKSPEIIEVSVARLEELKSRLASGFLCEEDKPVLLAIVSAYVWIQRQLESARLTIHRLKKMFGFSTEKRKKSGEKGEKTDLKLDLATLGTLNNQQEPLNGLQANPEEPVKNPPVWDEAANHGRIGANSYTGCEKVMLSHPTLAKGSACPHCADCNTVARLGQDGLKVVVRLIGSPLITGTQYIAPILRCNVCKARFYTPIPDSIKNAPKYAPSCASALAIARYSLGIPMFRIEQDQSMHGIPMKDATQWDIHKGLYGIACPVFNVLQKNAANGLLTMYDDTTGRILENQVKEISTHTTAFMSVYEGHKIHLFFTGQNHAGKNADAIFAQRTSKEPVIAMMDASPSNIPKHLSQELVVRFILCFCLVHGRRKFFKIMRFFDKECDFVLNLIGQVYANDAYCINNKLSPDERLHYHQKYSGPLMQQLFIWLNNQLVYEQSEPNSGLVKRLTIC